jgi:hypothetical protein
LDEKEDEVMDRQPPAVADQDSGDIAVHPYIYAIGRIVPRAPSLGIEKEFAQASGRTGSDGLTDQQTLHEVLSQYRYLARQFCYILSIEGTDAYILQPRDPVDFDRLREAIRPTPSPLDIDVVIGIKGPLAPPEMCNGLTVHRMAFDQIYSFDRDTIFGAITPPTGATKQERDQLIASAQDLFDRIQRSADNFGDLDEHRAINYLAVRYDQIYRQTAAQFAQGFSLSRLHTVPSRLSSARRLINVVFTYTHRQTGVSEMYRVRVDVTEEFPFLDTRLEAYYEIER